MTTRWWTITVLLSASAALILWDIYVAATPPGGDTISEIMLGWARKHPIVPFALGVLMGHLFWSQ